MEYVAGVWAVSSVAGPLDVRVMDLGSGLSHAVGVTATPGRIFNGAIDRLLLQNLSTSPIEIGSVAGIQYGTGTRIPARSQWSLRYGVVSIGAADADAYSSRPQPWDRNPLIINPMNPDFAGNLPEAVAPHANTVRWNYNVPVNRLCLVLLAEVEIIRVTAAAPVGRCTAYIRIAQAANDALGPVTALAYSRLYTNGVGDRSPRQPVGQTVVLNSGDGVSGMDEDLSTGGTVSFLENFVAVEYDK